jgi:hypothetical protein
MSLADWKVKADLTYATMAAPEQVEKRVRWWLRQVAPGCKALGGIEYQSRGSAHAHVIIDQYIDFRIARELWQDGAGWCWLQAIRNGPRAVGYAIKDAVKRGEVNIYSSSAQREFSTDPSKKAQKNYRRPYTSPTEYEMAVLKEINGKARRACESKIKK